MALKINSMIVYEYLVIKEDWSYGDLSKGTRLYYDYDKGGYVYHYERDEVHSDDKYSSKSHREENYFISIDLANKGIQREALTVGPELGEFEPIKGAANGTI
jgi:hypothetical protein